MRNFNLCLGIMAAGLLAASCGNKGNGQGGGSAAQEVVVPDGYKTHEFAHFTISLPEEFTTTYDASSDNVRFYSEAMLKLADGEEQSSSATVDCGFMPDGATPSQLKETASTMKMSQEAAGETCDEPIIDGNIILMRHYHQADDYKVITWRWWIVSDDAGNIAGNICYPDTQAKHYDDVAKKIVKTIKLK